ncbi:MAG: restriction endonuclease [Hungatella sp.]|nr:restriction endonuclease [Hungatella sp.]
MLSSLDMVNNYTGIDFENGCMELLEYCGFEASKTGEKDRGVDIIAYLTINDDVRKYFIQCKYQNKTLSTKPIQEVFSGSYYHGNDVASVLITNNNVSYGAREYAKALHIEIISTAERIELKEAYRNKNIINPDRQGLAGILIGILPGNQEITTYNLQVLIPRIDNSDALKEIVIDKFDKLLEYRKEADRFRQQVSIFEQKAIIMQREEMLKYLGLL